MKNCFLIAFWDRKCSSYIKGVLKISKRLCVLIDLEHCVGNNLKEKDAEEFRGVFEVFPEFKIANYQISVSKLVMSNKY